MFSLAVWYGWFSIGWCLLVLMNFRTRILRHMASELNLNMRNDGYVKVEDLLKLNLKTFANIPLRSHTIDDIREVGQIVFFFTCFSITLICRTKLICNLSFPLVNIRQCCWMLIHLFILIPYLEYYLSPKLN